MNILFLEEAQRLKEKWSTHGYLARYHTAVLLESQRLHNECKIEQPKEDVSWKKEGF